MYPFQRYGKTLWIYNLSSEILSPTGRWREKSLRSIVGQEWYPLGSCQNKVRRVTDPILGG